MNSSYQGVRVVFTLHLGVSKNMGNPQIIHFHRVFHEINHPFWGKTQYLDVCIHLFDLQIGVDETLVTKTILHFGTVQYSLLYYILYV